MNKWSGIPGFFRKNAFMVKILSSYVIAGSILLCGLSFLMYNSYTRAIHQEIERHSEKILNQSHQIVDTYWASTFSYLSRFHVNPGGSSTLNDHSLNSGSVFKALFSDSFDALEMGDISKKLTEIASSNPIVHSIYIYNSRADSVFSNLTVANPIDSFFDREFIDAIRSGEIRQEMTVKPRKVSFTLGTRTVDYYAISIIFIEDSEGGTPTSVLAFNLKLDDLQSIIQPQGADGATQFLILDRAGKIISHPRSELINTDISQQPYIRSILDSKAAKGHFTTAVDGRKSIVNYVKSSNSFGWIFVGVGDYRKLHGNFDRINETVLLLAAVFIVLSLLIGVLFTRRFDRTFDRLVHNVNELKASVREGMPAVRHDFLRQVLHGTIVKEDILSEQAAKLKLRLSGPAYVVCVLRFTSFAELGAKLSERDLALLRFAVINIAEETLAPSFPVEAADAGADHAALVVNVKEWNEQAEAELTEKLQETQSNAEKYTKLILTAGIGEAADRLSGLHESYVSALKSTEYRLVYGKQSIIRASEAGAFPKVAYEYPFDIEKKINEALRSADRDKTMDAFEAFLQEVCRFSNDEILLSLTQLALSSVDLLPSSTAGTDHPVELSYKTVIGELGKCDDLDDVRQRFERLYGEVIEGIRDKKELKNKDIADMITEYAQTHFRDPNLTVERISEVVSLSSNYVRTIFKNHADQSLSGYISELRFEEAKRLLLATDDHANKIAGDVGFSSGKYFYASFKKYTGQTPDEFRRTHRGNA